MRRGIAVFLIGVAALAAATPAAASPPLAPQELDCVAKGWNGLSVNVNGSPRMVLWKKPVAAWRRGAILVMHGGGGRHFNWCAAGGNAVAAQVRFSEMAVARGFAVFLLDSSEQVRDREGRACDKVWDDEVHNRANIDLPFIEKVIRDAIPALRPEDSANLVFLTGLSAGGYMATRAGTRFPEVVDAVAAVASGDPYGWHRQCVAGLTPRKTVHGVPVDNDTGLRVNEPGACAASRYDNEMPWDGAAYARSPVFRLFHHEFDGAHDSSCAVRLEQQLAARGYPREPTLWVKGDGQRSFRNHLWQDAYSAPVLEFFVRVGARLARR